MKAKLYIALALFVGVFASCEQKEEVRVYPNTASQDIAGTYSGTWTLTNDKGESSEAIGTIAFTATDQAYVANIMVTAEGSADRKDVCNVSHANDGLVFYNNVGTAFGAKFSGEIDANGNILMSYTITEMQGRFQVTNSYNFSGARK